MGLLDGDICLKNHCSKCCWNTEMILTDDDIQRIEKLGFKREEFAVFDGKYWRLRNVEGHCFFLDPSTGKCKIYEHRPLGCRVYPVILDESTGLCVVDTQYCPFAHLITIKEFVTGCSLLKSIITKLEMSSDVQRKSNEGR